PRALDEEHEIRVTGPLARSRAAAETRECVAASRGLGHPRGEVLLDPRVDVELQLLVDVGVEIAPAEHVRDAVEPAHRSECRSTCATAPMSDAQFFSSSASWRRPAAVIE